MGPPGRHLHLESEDMCLHLLLPQRYIHLTLSGTSSWEGTGSYRVVLFLGVCGFGPHLWARIRVNTDRSICLLPTLSLLLCPTTVLSQAVTMPIPSWDPIPLSCLSAPLVSPSRPGFFEAANSRYLKSAGYTLVYLAAR